MFNFDFGDRIPEGFIPDESLAIAGKAIEDVAKHRWLNAEELLLLLMLPKSLHIEYINTLPSADVPYQVGRIYLLAGDSKQSMFDGIEYEKRQTEDRSNTQSGIYSQLSINKRQVIEGVYSTTGTNLRRRYYYMRDENERIRKVIHYRHITEAELQEATNRREGKKKPTEETSSKKGRKSAKADVGDNVEDEELESPKHNNKKASGANPNKTIPIHFSVLYNCYKYLFYKDLERLTGGGSTKVHHNKSFGMANNRSPAAFSQQSKMITSPGTTMMQVTHTPMQYTYVRSEEDGGGYHSQQQQQQQQRQSQSFFPSPHNNPQQQAVVACQAISVLSPQVFTHHSLKYTQHCTILLASPSLSFTPGSQIEVFYDKVLQDPSLMIPGANIPLEEARVRGLGKQLAGNILECCLTPALSAGRWKLTIFDQNHQLIAYTDHEGAMLTIVEESRAERFESMKRRRQKSNSIDAKRLEDIPPAASYHHYYHHPTPNQAMTTTTGGHPYPNTASGSGRMDSDHSSGMMMHEAISLLLRRGSSQERENDNENDETMMMTTTDMMMLDDRQNNRHPFQQHQTTTSARAMSEGIAVVEDPLPMNEIEDFSRSGNMQAYFAERQPLTVGVNQNFFATTAATAADFYRNYFPHYSDMQQYSYSETDSYAVSSSATLSEAENSANDSSMENEATEREGLSSLSQNNHHHHPNNNNNEEIIRILSQQMSLGEEGEEGVVEDFDHPDFTFK